MRVGTNWKKHQMQILKNSFFSGKNLKKRKKIGAVIVRFWVYRLCQISLNSKNVYISSLEVGRKKQKVWLTISSPILAQVCYKFAIMIDIHFISFFLLSLFAVCLYHSLVYYFTGSFSSIRPVFFLLFLSLYLCLSSYWIYRLILLPLRVRLRRRRRKKPPFLRM